MARMPRAIALGGLLPLCSALGQSPATATWEPFLLVSRTSSYVAYDARSFSNGNLGAYAATIGLRRARALPGLRIEVSIVRKGFINTQPTFRWTYLEVPIVLEFEGSKPTAFIRPVAQIGVAPSIALSCTVYYQTGRDSYYRGSCDGRDPLGAVTTRSPVDLGLVLGAGLHVRAGARRILLEVRYTRGWVPVAGTAKQRVLSAGVGVTFPRVR